MAVKGGRKVSQITPPKTTIALLFDTSGSMAGSKIKQVKIGAIQFASSAIEKAFSVGVFVFGDRGAAVLEPTVSFAMIVSKLQELRIGTVGSSTNLTAGLQLCAEVPCLHAVVVVTDGMPNDPASALGVAGTLKSSGVEILVIATDDADRDFVRRLASRFNLAIQIGEAQICETLAGGMKLLLGAGLRT